MAFEAEKLLGNRYRILRHLSAGMIATYLAEDTLLRGQQVVIEPRPLFPGQQQQQIQQEISLLLGLNHPNILRLLDYGTEADTPYLVFEYTPKGTLRDRHPRGSQVPLPTVVEYVKQVASALQYIHDQGIIHRDVKPENLLLGNDSKILLSDFGIAITYPGTTASSPAGAKRYMAPEQFRGEAVPASDQYSLGVVVYEWLCGRPPFSEGNFIQLAYQHRYELPPPLTTINPTIPRDVEQVVLRALAKNPQERFHSVLQFAQALEQASRADLTPPPMMSFLPSLPQQVIPMEPEDSLLESMEGSFEDNENVNHAFPPSASSPSPTAKSPNAAPNFDRTIAAPSPNEEQPESQLSLYALASARLEADDRAMIGKQYNLEAGLTQQRPENFVGEPFRVAVRNPAEPLLFHIMLHASPNIQLLGAWYQPLRYYPLNVEPQFITCPFRLIVAGESYLLINFYRERQWLKSIRLEFEGIKQTSFSNATNWR